jgi:UPF0716 family protein affecting phage T7 exclusion
MTDIAIFMVHLLVLLALVVGFLLGRTVGSRKLRRRAKRWKAAARASWLELQDRRPS